MDPFARYALFGCIVASGVGGLITSIVAFKYGLVPPDADDPPELIHRRLFVTHLGHAGAAVAFAISIVLAGAVLVTAGGAGAGPRSDMQAIAQRVDNVEGLVQRMTETLEEAVASLERRPAGGSAR